MAMATTVKEGRETAAAAAEEEEVSKRNLKEGERIVGSTRRPDGTLRKPIRIRAGYVPQDEVALYQSKASLWKKEMSSLEVLPPGYDPALDVKPKTKSAKRNERKKEKRIQQATLDKGQNSEKDEISSVEDVNQPLEASDLISSHIDKLNISENYCVVKPPSNSTKHLTPGEHIPDIDKRIRALKKKIRLAEAQKGAQGGMKPEQLEKLAKLEEWCKELKLLEDKRAQLVEP
ncbi:hypothetical protein LguiA_008570 [Lonicera macranthoides]